MLLCHYTFPLPTQTRRLAHILKCRPCSYVPTDFLCPHKPEFLHCHEVYYNVGHVLVSQHAVFFFSHTDLRMQTSCMCRPCISHALVFPHKFPSPTKIPALVLLCLNSFPLPTQTGIPAPEMHVWHNSISGAAGIRCSRLYTR